jgi:hypothetical protein
VLFFDEVSGQSRDERPGWSTRTSSDGGTYFVNKSTGASQWEVPDEVLDDWFERRDVDGRPFYTNNTTSECVWRKPRAWSRVLSVSTGQYYWVHASTGERSWETPDGVSDVWPPNAVSCKAPDADVWQAHVVPSDAEEHAGTTYYVNQRTRETSWSLPPGACIGAGSATGDAAALAALRAEMESVKTESAGLRSNLAAAAARAADADRLRSELDGARSEIDQLRAQSARASASVDALATRAADAERLRSELEGARSEIEQLQGRSSAGDRAADSSSAARLSDDATPSGFIAAAVSALFAASMDAEACRHIAESAAVHVLLDLIGTARGGAGAKCGVLRTVARVAAAGEPCRSALLRDGVQSQLEHIVESSSTSEPEVSAAAAAAWSRLASSDGSDAVVGSIDRLVSLVARARVDGTRCLVEWLSGFDGACRRS